MYTKHAIKHTNHTKAMLEDTTQIQNSIKNSASELDIKEILNTIYTNFPSVYKNFIQEKQNEKLLKQEIFYSVGYLQRKYGLTYEKAKEESEKIRKKELRKMKRPLQAC